MTKHKIIDGIVYYIHNGLFCARYCLGGAIIFKYGKKVVPEKYKEIYKMLTADRDNNENGNLL